MGDSGGVAIHELMRIALVDDASVVEARRKVRVLAEDLQLGGAVATALSVLTSEIARSAIDTPGDAGVRLGVDGEQTCRNAVVIIDGVQDPPAVVHVRSRADIEVRQIPAAEGLVSIELRVPVGEGAPAIDDEFTEAERERLIRRSAGELVEETKRQNRELTELLEELRTTKDVLAHKARELESVNRELEAFSYSVSHDLRAPLRAIDGFSQAVLEDYGDVLDDEGKSFLLRVRAASVKMAQLIDDLLGLSRLTRSEMVFGGVDLSLMADEIAEELREKDPDRDVEFGIQPGLSAVADATLMRIVLINLLGNAHKFTSGTEDARIEVGIENEDGRDWYFVRDNGAGFDMKYVDKLFGAFQRLHTPEEFEGTGIGLATVQRAIHRHGGRVRAQGAPGQGATVYFCLDVSKGGDDPDGA